MAVTSAYMATTLCLPRNMSFHTAALQRNCEAGHKEGTCALISSFTGRLSITRESSPSSKLCKRKDVRIRCASTRRKFTMPSHGFDYYELLGVDPKASSLEIKQAYRWLQKRCHPDIAGDVGHDMALLLNEAYSILIDLNMRITYDQLRVTWLEDESFSGKPLWSTWLGHPEEEQAVFVDESQCVGCLKCAIIAGETFAVETDYGRARAVKQWGNDEVTLQDAIDACPVDCIRWVQRSQLAALEHIMSKMPRMAVGLSNHSGEGKRQNVNVFNEVEKFLEKRARAQEASQPASSASPRSTAAAETIRVKSGRWWRPSSSSQGEPAMWRAAQQSQGALIPLDWVASPEEVAAARASRMFGNFGFGQASIPEELRTLHEAAQQRSEGREATSRRPNRQRKEEYWTPPQQLSCAVNFGDQQANARQRYRKTRSQAPQGAAQETERRSGMDSLLERLTASIPVLAAVAAAISVGLTAGDSIAQSATDIQAPLPSQFTTGVAAQVLFAAVVWYAIGAAVSGSVALFQVFVQGKLGTTHQDEAGK